jgi:hypothetical protein
MPPQQAEPPQATFPFLRTGPKFLKPGNKAKQAGGGFKTAPLTIIPKTNVASKVNTRLDPGTAKELARAKKEARNLRMQRNAALAISKERAAIAQAAQMLNQKKRANANAAEREAERERAERLAAEETERDLRILQNMENRRVAAAMRKIAENEAKEEAHAAQRRANKAAANQKAMNAASAAAAPRTVAPVQRELTDDEAYQILYEREMREANEARKKKLASYAIENAIEAERIAHNKSMARERKIAMKEQAIREAAQIREVSKRTPSDDPVSKARREEIQWALLQRLHNLAKEGPVRPSPARSLVSRRRTGAPEAAALAKIQRFGFQIQQKALSDPRIASQLSRLVTSVGSVALTLDAANATLNRGSSSMQSRNKTLAVQNQALQAASQQIATSSRSIPAVAKIFKAVLKFVAVSGVGVGGVAVATQMKPSYTSFRKNRSDLAMMNRGSSVMIFVVALAAFVMLIKQILAYVAARREKAKNNAQMQLEARLMRKYGFNVGSRDNVERKFWFHMQRIPLSNRQKHLELNKAKSIANRRTG